MPFSTPYILILLIVALILLGLGYLLKGYLAGSQIKEAEARAQRIIREAEKEAETRRKEAALEVKDKLYQAKADFERETKEKRQELANQERRLTQREETLDRKLDLLEKREQGLISKEREMVARERVVAENEAKYKALVEEGRRQLERVSGLTVEEAKRMLIQNLEAEVKLEAIARIKRLEEEAKETAERKAKEIISLAIAKCASDYVTEATVSVVDLPSDDMKGRIIGREGRNIRALEKATGVDLIVDDTPEAVILSGFDPVRREIARIALQRLIADGRIHPARIEEVVEKVKKEVEATIREAGEQAAFELGVTGLHPEEIKLIGRLMFRTSYAQNQLQHSKEVAHLAGVMAAELGLDARLAKRAGLLHDIGKAADIENEGSHAKISAELAKKYHEHSRVVNAIAAHHEEVEPQCMEAILVQAADALSAARPGARREVLETYVKRLEKLEKIADSFEGVDKAYAIQAGRELRIIVENEQVSDLQAAQLARDIARRIEQELEYPGQIRVTVIRETRATEYAK
ncbi:MAG: ribonuclease Y [candidate division NC10 bacterium]|nr:ribonuclease Y [candidate division NC10 bacterium]